MWRRWWRCHRLFRVAATDRHGKIVILRHSIWLLLARRGKFDYFVLTLRRLLSTRLTIPRIVLYCICIYSVRLGVVGGQPSRVCVLIVFLNCVWQAAIWVYLRLLAVCMKKFWDVAWNASSRAPGCGDHLGSVIFLVVKLQQFCLLLTAVLYPMRMEKLPLDKLSCGKWPENETGFPLIIWRNGAYEAGIRCAVRIAGCSIIRQVWCSFLLGCRISCSVRSLVGFIFWIRMIDRPVVNIVMNNRIIIVVFCHLYVSVSNSLDAAIVQPPSYEDQGKSWKI